MNESFFPLHPAPASVAVAMSGGVDSSVAVHLLKKQGYRVQGIFMKNWEEQDPDFPCNAVSDARDALSVCERLDIALDTVNFSPDYWERVFRHFLAEYMRGRTPNPDILCNKEIKFKSFLEHAQALGAEYIATGHYARIGTDGGGLKLLKASDANKDQTYFLYTLGQAQLAHTLFPVGELTKPEVRRLATVLQLSNAAKKDSTGLCFVGERNFKRFLAHFLPSRPGEIRTPDGELMGEHSGLIHYTLGQRKGLQIGGRRGTGAQPWYVVDKDLTSNVLVVVQGHEHPLLYSRALSANQLHWVSGEAPPAPYLCHAKTRYRQLEQACTLLWQADDYCRVEFAEPQWAITPGQSVVFYQGETCLGGGVIDAVLR